MTSSLLKMQRFGKIPCSKPDNSTILATSEVKWTEHHPPVPLEALSDIIRRTLQIPCKNGDVYEVTMALWEDAK